MLHSVIMSTTELRRLPQQSRGRRRVDALLDAAAAEINAAGYDAATMSAIASRAGASIGSLYQFFPNKAAITQALRSRYCNEFEQIWQRLASEARGMSLEELAIRLVDSAVVFVERHPAFLALLDAPPLAPTHSAAHERFQRLLATILLAVRPRMLPEKALRLAAVTMQMIKAMNLLYRDLPAPRRGPYVREFKMLLKCYFEHRIEQPDLCGRKLSAAEAASRRHVSSHPRRGSHRVKVKPTLSVG